MATPWRGPLAQAADEVAENPMVAPRRTPVDVSSAAAILKPIAIAASASLAVVLLGSLTWVPLLTANTRVSPQVPWSVPLEAIALALIWLYLSGHGWPRSTSAARKALLGARRVAPRTLALAWLAGCLALIALAGLWVVLVELTGAGGNPTLISGDEYPPLLIYLGVLMGSLVSPLTEEAAFRGFGQNLLKRSFPPAIAVALSSVFFALYHGPTQGFAPSKIFFYFVVGVLFGAMASLTRSVLPAIPVHIAGDLLFFTVVWPQDASRPLVWTSGADATFWVAVFQTLLFGTLALLAFARLATLEHATPQASRRNAA